MSKKIAYIDVNEWNRRVMHFVWMGFLNIVLVEFLLFLMYQPLPDCGKAEYFKLFVLIPTISQLSIILVMETVSRYLAQKLGEHLVTVIMVLGEFSLVGTMVAVHNSVPFMCMTLLYPVIFISVYREKYIRRLAVMLCIGLYAAITYGIIPGTEFQPPNNDLIYIIIFASFTATTIVCANVLTSVVVAFDSENQKLQAEKDKIIEDTRKDSMTGLYNHKAFYDMLNRQMASREGFSMIIIDIDDFKKINDTYGHAAGDQVLLEVVALIRKSIRKEDIASRYGGEEFAVLLPGKTCIEAYQVAEEIRRKCAEHRMPDIKGRVTISLGVAEWNRREENGILLFKQADESLYEAKRTGKNKTVCRK